MVTIITIFHVIVCLFLIFVVLLQAGKGGGMGLAFGGSNAGQVFGGSGAGNFLTRLTGITAVMFMLTSLTLAYLASARTTNWLTDYEKKTEAQAKREAALKSQIGASDGGAATSPSPVVVPPGDDKSEPAPAPAPEGQPVKSDTPKPETNEEKAPVEEKAPAPK